METMTENKPEERQIEMKPVLAVNNMLQAEDEGVAQVIREETRPGTKHSSVDGPTRA